MLKCSLPQVLQSRDILFLVFLLITSTYLKIKFLFCNFLIYHFWLCATIEEDLAHLFRSPLSPSSPQLFIVLAVFVSLLDHFSLWQASLEPAVGLTPWVPTHTSWRSLKAWREAQGKGLRCMTPPAPPVCHLCLLPSCPLWICRLHDCAKFAKFQVQGLAYSQPHAHTSEPTLLHFVSSISTFQPPSILLKLLGCFSHS